MDFQTVQQLATPEMVGAARPLSTSAGLPGVWAARHVVPPAAALGAVRPLVHVSCATGGPTCLAAHTPGSPADVDSGRAAPT